VLVIAEAMIDQLNDAALPLEAKELPRLVSECIDEVTRPVLGG
jgi:hypothetical protein